MWSNTPDAANKIALSYWARYDDASMDCVDNVSGKSTKV